MTMVWYLEGIEAELDSHDHWIIVPGGFSIMNVANWQLV
jgi:hypothetical protein